VSLFVSDFTIKELTGDQRVITLKERALPYRPLKFSGRTRGDFTWYPGNPVATTQILGTEEAPSVFNGAWKDRFIAGVTSDGIFTGIANALIDGQQIANVSDLVDVFNDVRQSAQPLEVTWAHRTRVGIMTRFDETWLTAEDVEWEMEFQWTSRGQPEQPVTIPVSPQPGDLADKLRAGLNTLKNVITAPFQVVQSFTDTVNELASEISDAIEDIESTAVQIEQQVLSPVTAAERTLAAVDLIIKDCNDLVSAVEAQPGVQLYYLLDTAETTYGDALVAADYGNSIKRAAQDIRTQCIDASASMSDESDGVDLLASFTARGDTDLRDVSQQFYGTPDQWRTLMLYNDFDDSQLTAGMLVLVPKLTSITKGA